MHGCHKCSKITATLFVILGLLFLAADFGWFNWGLSWYTALFLLLGVTMCAKSGCKDCQKVCK